MKTSIASRPARSSRPLSPRSAEFKSLDQAHQAALQMLLAFQTLVKRLDNEGLDAEAKKSAQAVLDFFDGPGRHHHEEEESKVFPGLLASSDAELAGHVRRLQQDHGWLEQDWSELRPHVQAAAEGYNGYDLPMLMAALPVFDALYRDHIALEETVVYPAAKRQLSALHKHSGGKPLVQ